MARMTRAEFAALIKEKYPAYADIDDDKLVDMMLSKYPGYRDSVLEEVQEEQEDSEETEEVEEINLEEDPSQSLQDKPAPPISNEAAIEAVRQKFNIPQGFRLEDFLTPEQIEEEVGKATQELSVPARTVAETGVDLNEDEVANFETSVDDYSGNFKKTLIKNNPQKSVKINEIEDAVNNETDEELALRWGDDLGVSIQTSMRQDKILGPIIDDAMAEIKPLQEKKLAELREKYDVSNPEEFKKLQAEYNEFSNQALNEILSKNKIYTRRAGLYGQAAESILNDKIGRLAEAKNEKRVTDLRIKTEKETGGVSWFIEKNFPQLSEIMWQAEKSGIPRIKEAFQGFKALTNDKLIRRLDETKKDLDEGKPVKFAYDLDGNLLGPVGVGSLLNPQTPIAGYREITLEEYNEWYENIRPELKSNIIGSIAKSEEIRKSIEYFTTSPHFFDPETGEFDTSKLTFKNLRKLAGDQAPQLVSSLIPGSSIIQETGHLYLDIARELAAQKHNKPLADVTPEEIVEIIEEKGMDIEEIQKQGLIAGGLDTVSTINLLGLARKFAVSTAKKGIKNRIVKDALKKGRAVAVESGTEGGQSVVTQSELERQTGRKLDWTQVKEEATAGALFSGILAGGKTVVQGKNAIVSQIRKQYAKDVSKAVDLTKLVNFRKEVIRPNLEKAVDNGTLTEEEAIDLNNDLVKTERAAEKLPDNVPADKREEIASIIKKRDEISESIRGKDPLLVLKEKEQIKALNNRIGEIMGVETGTDGKADDQKTSTKTPAQKALEQLDEGVSLETTNINEQRGQNSGKVSGQETTRNLLSNKEYSGVSEFANQLSGHRQSLIKNINDVVKQTGDVNTNRANYESLAAIERVTENSLNVANKMPDNVDVKGAIDYFNKNMKEQSDLAQFVSRDLGNEFITNNESQKVYGALNDAYIQNEGAFVSEVIELNSEEADAIKRIVGEDVFNDFYDEGLPVSSLMDYMASIDNSLTKIETPSGKAYKEALKNYYPDGKIYVYRGVTKGAPVESIGGISSFSVDPRVAMGFVKFRAEGGQGTIYGGWVDINNLGQIITSRGEQELIVYNIEDVSNITEVDTSTLENLDSKREITPKFRDVQKVLSEDVKSIKKNLFNESKQNEGSVKSSTDKSGGTKKSSPKSTKDSGPSKKGGKSSDVSTQGTKQEGNEELAKQLDDYQRRILAVVAPDIAVTENVGKGVQANVSLAKTLANTVASINIDPTQDRYLYSTGEEYAHTYYTSKLLADWFNLDGFSHLNEKIDHLTPVLKNTSTYQEVMSSIEAKGQYYNQAVDFMNSVNDMAKTIGSSKVMSLDQAIEMTVNNETFAKESGKALVKFVKNSHDESKLTKTEKTLFEAVMDFIKNIFKNLNLFLNSNKEVFSALEADLLEIILDPNSYLNINRTDVINRGIVSETDKVYKSKKEVEADLGLKGREYDVARRAVVNREYDGKAPKDKEGKHRLIQETVREILLRRGQLTPEAMGTDNELGIFQLKVEETLASKDFKAIKNLLKGDKKKAAAKLAIAVASMDGQSAAGLENAIANGLLIPIPANLDPDVAAAEALKRASAASSLISALTKSDIITIRKERKGQWYVHVLNGELVNEAYNQGMDYLDKTEQASPWTQPFIEKPPADWTNNKHETGLDAITKGSKKVSEKNIAVLNKAKNTPRRVNTRLLDIVENSLESNLLTYGNKIMSDAKRKIKSAPLFDTIRRAKAIGNKVYYALSKFDSRGRLNQMTTNLSTETNKLSKALGYFGVEEEIGIKGYNQMLIQLSDTEGEFTGESQQERIEYAESKLEEWFEMRDGTMTPFENMDEPFLFVATLEELYAANQLSDKYSFKSGLPIRKDATVSQGQQIAGFTKNRQLAEKLNLITTDKGRQDLYTDIGNVVLDQYGEFTAEQIQEANEIADELRGFDEKMNLAKTKEEWHAAAKEKNKYVWEDNREAVEKASQVWWSSKWNKFRTVMKKPLMTYIYGAGDKTIRRKLYEELKVEPAFANVNETFIFMLYNDIRKAYKQELGAILDYKRLLTKVANRHYKQWKDAKPEDKKKLEALKFVHPYDGFPFDQKYLLPITGTTAIKYLGTDEITLGQIAKSGEANVNYTVKNQDLDKDTMETSIGANFTHFGDGGLVRYSIAENDFVVDTVHDDFATIPSRTDELLQSLNDGMADLYADVNGEPVFKHIIRKSLGDEITNEIFDNDSFVFGDVNSNEYRSATDAFGAGTVKKASRDIASIEKQTKQDIINDIEERTKPC